VSGQYLSGPMFESAEDEDMKSVHRESGGHYNTFKVHSASAMKVLRDYFPDGKCNALNFVLFSTSGIHGTYTTLDEIETSLRKYGDRELAEDEDLPDDYHCPDLTFVIVQSRLVTMRYGEVAVTLSDIPFLRGLADSALAAVKDSQRGNYTDRRRKKARVK
jgi:hypothetical protein